MHGLRVCIGVDQRIWHFTFQEISLITLLVAIYNVRSIITVRNSSCGKVMFSQVSLCPQGGGVHPLPRQKIDTPWEDIHTPRQTPLMGRPPPPLPTADGHCSGRYASYWNAFLFTCRKQSSKIAQVHRIFFALFLATYNGELIPSILVKCLQRDKSNEMQMMAAKW